MKTSEALYAARDYIREHGFSFGLGVPGCARCMLGAIPDSDYGAASTELHHTLGMSDFTEATLERHGWTQGDAIAALEIAADIAYENER